MSSVQSILLTCLLAFLLECSSDLWISTTCPSTGCPAGIFNPSASSSFVDTHSPITLPFIQGAVSGTIATDKVTLAGLTIPSQSFVAVTQEDKSFGGFPTAGLLGLGFVSQAKTKMPTVIDNLVSTHHLASNLFALYLARHSVQGSSLSIGAPDGNHFVGSITYIPVVGSATYVSSSILPSLLFISLTNTDPLCYLYSGKSKLKVFKLQEETSLSMFSLL